MPQRISWDTSVKHYVRMGLYHSMPSDLKMQLSKSNVHRWKQEPEDKYMGCQLTDFISQDLELYKRIGQTAHLRKMNQAYIKLLDALHYLLDSKKALKTIIKNNKELAINAIEQAKGIVGIANALRVFNISRTNYQNYKSFVIHKCEASYFNWCTRRFPNQLLPKEVEAIKKYMSHPNYMFWSKSSIYLKAIREGTLSCSISTFYKYARLLGFKTRKYPKKSDHYEPKVTKRPHELWCADVTIFKTGDGSRHHIHFLMDHYSKMILAYRIAKHNSGKAIRDILKEATSKYKPNNLTFLTDGGSENINTNVYDFLNSLAFTTKHIIAQKDVVFSNSMIEALNKVIKHQFLFPKNLNSRTQLEKALKESVVIYNTKRPQWALGGNTPLETLNNAVIDVNKYKTSFVYQKTIRLAKNKGNNCIKCV